MWNIIVKNHFFFIIFWNTVEIFVTDVRKFTKDKYWISSHRATGRSAASVLSVDPSHINSPEVEVSDMICHLPLSHRNSKFQITLLAFSPLTQILGAWLPYHVWFPSFIPVTKFNTKIRMVMTLCENCDLIPVRCNGVFTADLAEYI